MATGPMVRRPSTERRYAQHRKTLHPVTCDFCQLATEGGQQRLRITDHMMIVRNIFGYDFWDGCSVLDHLMIVPRRHIVGIGEYDAAERNDFLDLVSHYEALGYSVYARTPDSIAKSIPHQHTHLIKIDNKNKKWLFYMRRPHIVVSK